ncbi:MAG TPA: multiheme c-type cytochrome, partial [bacterium]
MKRHILYISGSLLLFFSHSAIAKEIKLLPVSSESQACIGCHEGITPGIVEDWRTSRHSMTLPQMALKKPPLERRISNESIPDNLRRVVVGCYECHGQNPSIHKDSFDHMGFKIHVVVTPNDCKTCHTTEVAQYLESKKANAVDNLAKNPVYTLLVDTITSVKEIKDNKIIITKPSEHTKAETCFGCHGTVVEVKGMKTISTKLGEIEVPDLANWPNQGVGRINPDGSRGSCTACHPRHSFS